MSASISSIQTYRDLQASGVLAKRKLEIIDVLLRHSEISCRHITAIINREGKHSPTECSSVAGRLNSLVADGIVEKSYYLSPCAITGINVHKYSLILEPLAA